MQTNSASGNTLIPQQSIYKNSFAALVAFMLFCLFASFNFAFAQTTTELPEPSTQEIVVTGTKDAATLAYSKILTAMAVFDVHHVLAPMADLKFKVSAKLAELMLNDIRINIIGDGINEPISIDKSGLFIVPKLTQPKAVDSLLTANHGKQALRFTVSIRSLNVPAPSRRLGDLRLECEVMSEFVKDEISFLLRGALALAGGMCHAPMVGIGFRTERKILAANLVFGERKQSVQIGKDGLTFIPPLRDNSWADDSMIEFEFTPDIPDIAKTR